MLVVMRRAVSLLSLFLIPYPLLSQVLPKEGSSLNHRIIGFSFSQEKENATYTIEIAKGHLNNTDSFKKNIVKTIDCKTDKVIGEVPEFGSEYTWRTAWTKKGKKNAGELHHFATGMSSRIDSTSRLRIIKAAEKYKDAYVFADATGALYDMNGHAVWYLPNIKDKVNEDAQLWDLKMTPQGTITFITLNNIFEINFDGAVLWKGPNTGEVSGDSIEHYHHEFTRLDNGHYMALGSTSVMKALPGYKQSSDAPHAEIIIIKDSNQNYFQRLQFGTIMEYDEQGKLLWSWASSKYFMQSDLSKLENNKFEFFDKHENSFFFDEQNKYVYISCRNISRIIKVKYPEGTVAAAYGNKYAPGVTELGNDLFCGQHSIRHSKHGYLYVYNNNSFPGNPMPKIDIMQEPAAGGDELQKIWEYQTTLDGLTENEKKLYTSRNGNRGHGEARTAQLKIQFAHGGNVVELPDQSMFVSTSSPVSKLFIIDRDKNILWNSVLEARPNENEDWGPKLLYRASIITERADLERMIWNSEAQQSGQ